MKHVLLAPAFAAWGVVKLLAKAVSGITLFALFVASLPFIGLLHVLNALNVHGGGTRLVWCAATLHDWSEWQSAEWSKSRVCQSCGKSETIHYEWSYM